MRHLYCGSVVLHALVDTSTWLDLAKRRDGQKRIVSVRLLATGVVPPQSFPQL